MSDAGEPFDAGPMDGSPPDLFAGAPDWESPLTDLTDTAAGGDDVRRDAGGALPDHEQGAERDAGGVPDGAAPPAERADPGAAGSLPDLTAGSATDAPPRLSGPAAAGLPDLAGPTAGGPADHGADGLDLWAPVPQAVPLDAGVGEGDEPLSDLTRRPRRGRLAAGGRVTADAGGRGAPGRDTGSSRTPADGAAPGRDARSSRPSGGRGKDDAGGRGAAGRRPGRPRTADGDGPGGPVPARPTARDRPRDPRGTPPGPVAEALAAARDLGSRSGSVDDASTPAGHGDAPRGLATGGPIAGLEPGTLFGPGPGDGPEASGSRGGKRRRGRRRGDEQTPSADAAATEPERPQTAEERLQHALKLSYRHLTKRDRTVSEVRAHLERRQVDEAAIAGAIAELLEFGYLDDERYATRYVEDKRRLEGWGHLRIEQGLRRTGVPREVADRAVAADPQRGDEAELAVETLEQRLNGRAPEDDRGRQKALRLLATRGYALETAYEAVRAYERRCAQRDDD